MKSESAYPRTSQDSCQYDRQLDQMKPRLKWRERNRNREKGQDIRWSRHRSRQSDATRYTHYHDLIVHVHLCSYRYKAQISG